MALPSLRPDNTTTHCGYTGPGAPFTIPSPTGNGLLRLQITDPNNPTLSGPGAFEIYKALFQGAAANSNCSVIAIPPDQLSFYHQQMNCWDILNTDSTPSAILRILGGVTSDHGSAIVTEYLAGHSLQKYCHTDTDLSHRDIAEIGLQIALALQYAHSQNVSLATTERVTLSETKEKTSKKEVISKLDPKNIFLVSSSEEAHQQITVKMIPSWRPLLEADQENGPALKDAVISRDLKALAELLRQITTGRADDSEIFRGVNGLIVRIEEGKITKTEEVIEGLKILLNPTAQRAAENNPEPESELASGVPVPIYEEPPPPPPPPPHSS